MKEALKNIKDELKERLAYFKKTDFCWKKKDWKEEPDTTWRCLKL